jgi:hypothetical protein
VFLYTRKFTATGSKYFFQYQPFRIRNIDIAQITAILQGATFITGNGIPGIIDNNGYIGVKAAGGRSGEQGHFLFFSVQNLNYCGKFFCRKVIFKGYTIAMIDHLTGGVAFDPHRSAARCGQQ